MGLRGIPWRVRTPCQLSDDDDDDEEEEEEEEEEAQEARGEGGIGTSLQPDASEVCSKTWVKSR